MSARPYATAAALVLLGALSSCAASSPQPSAAGSSPSAAASQAASTAAAPTAQQRCLAQFSDDQLLSWTTGTVAQFRAYQYGGPTPTRPMTSAFSGLPGETPGAWCGTRVSEETIRWWAVVDDQKPVKAIDITGPGEGTRRGEAGGPPVVP